MLALSGSKGRGPALYVTAWGIILMWLLQLHDDDDDDDEDDADGDDDDDGEDDDDDVGGYEREFKTPGELALPGNFWQGKE